MRAVSTGQQGAALAKGRQAGRQDPRFCLRLQWVGEVGGRMTKRLPLLGMRRQQGRDRGEMECWETRAERLPAVESETS